MQMVALLLILLLTVPVSSLLIAAEIKPPSLLLAKVYHSGISLGDYWVSEKLDGVRAYWDGKRFISRQGNQYQAPSWFTAELPDIPLDGEFWIGPNQFDLLSGTVRRQLPEDSAWRQVKFMVFDLPGVAAPFDTRLEQLQTVLKSLQIPWVQPVPQTRILNEKALMEELDAVVSKGGEGLMLHRGDSLYQGARSADLLKLKPYQDAEAVVIAHLPGRGKYLGLMGSLLVETPDGVRFRLGSGFSDQLRREPPALGASVTYRFSGLSSSGKPRFARFVRIRDEI